ncbi:MAG: N-acetylmuramoyl-L-alanine amidase [Actinomycetota bacterium]
MSIRGILLGGMLLLGACAVGERPMLADDAALEGRGALDGDPLTGGTEEAVEGAAAAATTSTPPTVEGPAETPPAEPAGDAPPTLITPTGMLVPVVGVDPAGVYTVQTPCGAEAQLRWGQPLRAVDVVIDPGHGGDEQGAIGPSGETEAELNLDIARRTAALLDAEGVTVALTRSGDYRVPIRMRAAIADRLGASVLLSIHHNSPTPTPGPTNGPGTEVYVQSGSAESARLGGIVHEELVAALSVFDADWASSSSAGVLTVINDSGEDAYGINRYPLTVSALAELAYLSNPTEALVLATDEYRQSSAQALTRSLIRFLDDEAGGTAPNEEPRLFTPSGATGGPEGCVDPPLE